MYLQIAREIGRLAADGSVAAGAKLPSVRKLADALGINPATVVSAYRILERDGAVEARAGSGVYLKETAGSAFVEDREGDPYWNLQYEGSARNEARILDLSSNAPARELFPVAEFREAIDEVIERDGAAAFDYQEPSGYAPLRNALAAALPGAPLDPADLHLVSGAQQGLDVVVRALVRPGDSVATESPGYRGATEVFRAAGARVERIPMTKRGIDLDALEAAAKRARLRLVYANPAFQNPTTVSYDDATRRGLLALADEYGFTVIEDELLAELAYGAAPRLPNLRSLDQGGRVVLVRSFSKILMPGLRAAFVAAPPGLRRRIDALKRSSDLSSGGLVQRALELFVRRGMLETQVARLRDHYARVHDAFVAAFGALRASGCAFDAPGGGLNLWLTLPEGLSSHAVHETLRARGCLVVPEAFFEPDGRDAHLRVGFAPARAEDAVRAAGIVAEALTALGKPAGDRPAGPRVIV